jgi:hypothetical protein
VTISAQAAENPLEASHEAPTGGFSVKVGDFEGPFDLLCP